MPKVTCHKCGGDGARFRVPGKRGLYVCPGCQDRIRVDKAGAERFPLARREEKP